MEFLFGGDVTPAYRMNYADSVKLFSDDAKERINFADVFIWNLETSGKSDYVKKNSYIFHADDRFFPQLNFENGVAITANNHIFDGYQEGAADLYNSLEFYSLRHNGLHKRGNYVPAKLETIHKFDIYILSGAIITNFGKGKKMYVLNYGAVNAQIKKIRDQDANSLIIIYFHDGKEKDPAPTARQRDWVRIFAVSGADIVVFSHSHLYEHFEVLENTPRKTFVCWGLGNFLFGGNGHWKNKSDVRLLSVILDADTGEKSGRWIYGYTKNWTFYLKSEELSYLKKIKAE